MSSSSLVHPSFMMPGECASVIGRAMQVAPMDSEMRVGDARVRGGQVRWLYSDPLQDRLRALLDEAEVVLGVQPSSSMEALQFTTYHSGTADWYDWHVDSFGRPFDRRLSVSVQVSDPSAYAGGDLLLRVPDPPDPTIARSIGTAIAFPSSTWHCASPVTAGVRHALVAWRSG